MVSPAPQVSSGREVRLLLLVVTVAVAVLLVLARFRFPSVDLTPATPAIDALADAASRTPFTDLEHAVSDLTARIAPAFELVRLDRDEVPRARRGSPKPDAPLKSPSMALRVRPTVLLAYLPAGMRVIGIDGSAEPPEILAVDVARELALIHTSANSKVTVDLTETGDFAGGTYVGVVEAGLSTSAIRPVFVPRVEPISDSRWTKPLLAIGGEPQLGAGAFLFTLDGRFVGLTTRVQGGITIIPAAALDSIVSGLPGGAGQ
jgi:hypothetical protein